MRLKKLLPSVLSVTFSLRKALTWKFLLVAVGLRRMLPLSPSMTRV